MNRRRHLTAAELRSQARLALAAIKQMQNGSIGEPIDGYPSVFIDKSSSEPSHQLGWALATLKHIADGRTAEARWADEARAAELAKAPS